MNVNLNIPYKQLQGFSQNGNELAHYGVKGMKWGQHKKLGKTSFAKFGKKVGKKLGKAMKTSVAKVKQHNATRKQKKHAKDLKKGRTNKMSNQELKDYVSRLQMEKQYKQLQRDLKGKSFGGRVKQGIIDAVAKQPGKQIQSLFDSHRQLNRTMAKQALNDQINERRYKRDQERKKAEKQKPSAKQRAQQALATARAKRMLQVLKDQNHPQHYRALFNTKVQNRRPNVVNSGARGRTYHRRQNSK